MRTRSLIGVIAAAFALTACSDSATSPKSPTSQLVAPAAPHFDLVATNNQINSLIDQIYASPVIRSFVHQEWNWLASQVVQCPPTTSTLRLQAYLNQLTSYLQTSVPKNNSAKAALLAQLIADMSSYVNEAIADCSTT